MLYEFGILGLILPLVAIAVLLFVMWIIMLVDAATRKFKNDTDKVVWILVIVLTGIIGQFIYYFVIYHNDDEKSLRWLWITLVILGAVAILGLFLMIISFYMGSIITVY